MIVMSFGQKNYRLGPPYFGFPLLKMASATHATYGGHQWCWRKRIWRSRIFCMGILNVGGDTMSHVFWNGSNHPPDRKMPFDSLFRTCPCCTKLFLFKWYYVIFDPGDFFGEEVLSADRNSRSTDYCSLEQQPPTSRSEKGSFSFYPSSYKKTITIIM